MNDVALNGKVYYVSNECSLNDIDNILNIHKYLIKKQNEKRFRYIKLVFL